MPAATCDLPNASVNELFLSGNPTNPVNSPICTGEWSEDPMGIVQWFVILSA
jgi:hypothetical protein